MVSIKKRGLTAIIPARNEEKNIKRCLESLSFCDKIIVMWMGDDDTGKIAAGLGAQVVKQEVAKKDDFKKVQKNINWAINSSETEWILRVDADEVVTNELRIEIQEILKMESQGFVAYGIPRKQYFWGGFLMGGDWAYDRLVRLFKKGRALYDPIVSVHEQFKVNGKIGYLKNSLLHYSHPTLSVAVDKFNVYTDEQIKTMKDSKLSAIFKMFTQPTYIFLRWMIWHHGYRDGLRGIVAGAFRAWYEFMLYAKYLEK